MSVIARKHSPAYPHVMPSRTTARKAATKGRSTPSAGKIAREYPNRIVELMKARGWTYPQLAQAVQDYAATIDDRGKLKTTAVSMNRLAIGTTELTLEWMRFLAAVFSVAPEEIIAKPIMDGMRRVKVMGALRAGVWAEAHQWAIDEQYEIMIPDDPAMRNVALYAGLLQGESMNRRYPDGAIIILSRITQKPGEIVEGRRYHVRLTHADGLTEETIKTLARDAAGEYWLKPESDHPEFQEWISLDGKPGTTVELIGRVRGVFHRED